MNSKETVSKILSGELRYKHYWGGNEVLQELKKYPDNSYALLHLGRYSETFNRERAIEYYKQSILLDNSTAMAELAHLCQCSSDYSRIKILDLLKKARKLNDAYGYLYSADLYQHGYLVKRDMEKASKYYYKSQKYGYHNHPFEKHEMLKYLFDQYWKQRKIVKKQQIRIEELEYAPGGSEYQKAKADFESFACKQ